MSSRWVASTGDVYREHFVLNSACTGGSWTATKIFTGWKTRTRIIAPGDVTGDYVPDLLSVDSGGTMWIYPGKGNGTFGSRFSVRTGWNQYNSVRGHGDFTGDGKADLLARQAGEPQVSETHLGITVTHSAHRVERWAPCCALQARVPRLTRGGDDGAVTTASDPGVRMVASAPSFVPRHGSCGQRPAGELVELLRQVTAGVTDEFQTEAERVRRSRRGVW